VITVDIEREPDLPRHARIMYLLGSSTSPEIVRQIEALVKPGETVMAVLDSDHHAPHVLKELETYSRMVTPGQYLVVEDTNINGHPVWKDGARVRLKRRRSFWRGTGISRWIVRARNSS